MYDIGTFIDLRKDKNKHVNTYVPTEYEPGTFINIWALRRQRFVEKFSMINITGNLLASAWQTNYS